MVNYTNGSLGAFVAALFLGLVLGGCAVPVHQRQAADSFEKAIVAYADFLEQQLPKMVDAVTQLEMTSIALQPTLRHPDNRIPESRKKLVSMLDVQAKAFRVFASMPVTILEDDRDKQYREQQELRDFGIRSAEIMKVQAPDYLWPEYEEVKQINKDVRIKQFAEGLTKKIGILLSQNTAKMTVNVYEQHVQEVQIKASQVFGDSTRTLTDRLAALEQYKIASVTLYEAKEFDRGSDKVRDGVRSTTDGLARALQDSSYSKKDLNELIRKTNELLKDIEKYTAVLKNLITLIAF